MDTNFVFSTKEDAEKVLTALRGVIKSSVMVYVSDLYDLIGRGGKITYEDLKYGWKDLSKAQIKKVEQGYLLELPPVEVISKENK